MKKTIVSHQIAQYQKMARNINISIDDIEQRVTPF